MASPDSTGGGGTHFEARVVAYYLAAAQGHDFGTGNVLPLLKNLNSATPMGKSFEADS